MQWDLLSAYRIKKLNLGKTASDIKQILSRFFNAPSALGIIQVEKEIGSQISVSNLRQDIFERFDLLKSWLE